MANATSQDFVTAHHWTLPQRSRRDGQMPLPAERLSGRAIPGTPQEAQRAEGAQQPVRFCAQRPPSSTPAAPSPSQLPPHSEAHTHSQPVPHPHDPPQLFLSDYGTPAANLQINGSDSSIGDYSMNLRAPTMFQDPSIRLTGERAVTEGPFGGYASLMSISYLLAPQMRVDF